MRLMFVDTKYGIHGQDADTWTATYGLVIDADQIEIIEPGPWSSSRQDHLAVLVLKESGRRIVTAWCFKADRDRYIRTLSGPAQCIAVNMSADGEPVTVQSAREHQE